MRLKLTAHRERQALYLNLTVRNIGLWSVSHFIIQAQFVLLPIAQCDANLHISVSLL